MTIPEDRRDALRYTLERCRIQRAPDFARELRAVERGRSRNVPAWNEEGRYWRADYLHATCPAVRDCLGGETGDRAFVYAWRLGLPPAREPLGDVEFRCVSCERIWTRSFVNDALVVEYSGGPGLQALGLLPIFPMPNRSSVAEEIERYRRERARQNDARRVNVIVHLSCPDWNEPELPVAVASQARLGFRCQGCSHVWTRNAIEDAGGFDRVGLQAAQVTELHYAIAIGQAERDGWLGPVRKPPVHAVPDFATPEAPPSSRLPTYRVRR